MSDDVILDVIPATEQHLEALLRGAADFEREFHMRPAGRLVEFEGTLERSLAALRKGVAPHWSTHLFIYRADRTLIGIGGFTGPPEQGVVEIGYSIAPEYRGAGFATAAARRLARILHGSAGRRCGDAELFVGV